MIGGLPVDHASVYARINGGNLIQLATERSDVVIDAQPTTAADARHPPGLPRAVRRVATRWSRGRW
jgi:hypothetical protein